MSFYDEELWLHMEKQAKKEDEDTPRERQIANEYIATVKKLCEHGIGLSKTISQTFPLYTLHDETHIINVIRLMSSILGEHIGNLSRDEAAMLCLAACCHDIGMSYTEEQRKDILENNGLVMAYLEQHKDEYVRCVQNSNEPPVLQEDTKLNILRVKHHERIAKQVPESMWTRVLSGKLSRRDLIRICQSHGEDVETLKDLACTQKVDLRLCAVLLRLADILDFDDTRTPMAIYQYNYRVFQRNAASKFSEKEWEKHLNSDGFDYCTQEYDRTIPYELRYSATCYNIQAEQEIHAYLDWVDREMSGCRQLMDGYKGRHMGLMLPKKVSRNIEAMGYESGEYHLTMEQGKVMELLVGRDLYNDPAVFVRELLQNAIDAVRTREKLDTNKGNWKGEIRISTWRDKEGLDWFRIADNGTGMTEDIIKNYFLKVGNSYYNSADFEVAKIKSNVKEYTPISRFGIGILSCFMGDPKTNLVEVATKHYENGPSLRMRMEGLNGYYYLANENYWDGKPMPGRTEEEQIHYLKQPGTVIAVRTSLYQTSKYKTFKEIVDEYVMYPTVPIHYDGEDVNGGYDYIMEDEFNEAMMKINPSDNPDEDGVIARYTLSDEQIAEIQQDFPEIEFDMKPELIVKCISLKKSTLSENLSGAVIVGFVRGHAKPLQIELNGEKVDIVMNYDYFCDVEEDVMAIKLSPPDEFKQKWRTWCAKNQKKTDWRFLFRLEWEKKEWFQKYFEPVKKSSSVVYNGIYCGNDDVFENIYSIILLKEQHRPTVDLARSDIKRIPLETACVLQIIGRQLGLKARYPLYKISGEGAYIPAEKYEKVLDTNKKIIPALRFLIDSEELSVAKMDERIQRGELVEYQKEYDRYYLINGALCLTYLRSHYAVYADMSEQGVKIFVTKGMDESYEKTKAYFPVDMFLPFKNDISCFTTSDRLFRKTCNASHKLSQFLIEHAPVLKEKVPGIFEDIVRSVCCDAAYMIESINNSLKRIHDLYAMLNIDFSADLYLKEDDFLWDSPKPNSNT